MVYVAKILLINGKRPSEGGTRAFANKNYT